ncbi:MAG: Gfo/Idh/MocA family oxidoreductase [Hyphomicrobiaceae bacterium]|nr:Gfo/Idh/MocA family oxidoreductase [Hyphomicrobiaceae bacterium]
MLVGAGHIAKQHLSCLKTLKGVDVAGVCDLSAAAAEAAAERFGVAAWFTDYQAMLEATRPDVVHITTPPPSHFRLAQEALRAGAHVFIEKPATATYPELETLAREAATANRCLVEDYNYVFNKAPQAILSKIETGEFGAVTHVEVMICLDILGGTGFSDPNSPHSVLNLRGGAIADFLPHLASLAYVFVGPMTKVDTVWAKRRPSVLPFDEFRALVTAEHGTASLVFSANSFPDAFWLRVYGERMQATTNLFEARLTFDRQRKGPKPLRPFFSALEEGKAVRRAAFTTLANKFQGAAAYEGLHELLRRTYAGLMSGSGLPVTTSDILNVNQLVEALKPAEVAA